MIPLIIIIALVVAGIALILIDKKKQANKEMLEYVARVKARGGIEECHSLAHPDSMSGYISTDLPKVKPKFRTSSKLLKDAIRRSEMNAEANKHGWLTYDTLVITETKAKKPSNKKRVTIRKKQVKNGKVPKVRKPR